MNLSASIIKPTLLLDESAARRNIRRMLAKVNSSGVSFRPHFKTHQSVEVGEWFRQEGVQAITVSSLDMAEYFAAAGWEDITIAFSANLRQLPDLSRLAGRIRLGLLAESIETLQALEQGLEHPTDLWLKIDSGTGRTGLPWDHSEEILALARCAWQSKRLSLRGLLTHAGITYSAPEPAAAAGIAAVAAARLNRLRNMLESAGIGPLLISTGDTPGCSGSLAFPGVDEIRPGNFVFYDAKQFSAGACQAEDIAVALAVPLVALHPERGEAVVYGGAVHLSSDAFILHGERIHGLVARPPEKDGQRWGQPVQGGVVARLSQEHGILRLPQDLLAGLHIGDLLYLLPAHSCLAAQCMGSYLTLDGRRVEMLRS